jgi:hypothetical protein
MKEIKDKKELVKLCSFIVMGDGGVYKYNGNKECAFVMNMIAKNEDYVLLCRDILENVTSTRIVEVDKGENRQLQLRLTTKGHPFFTKLRERIYIDKYKSLDQHALKMLDYEALSFLYMSDGSLVIKKEKYPCVTLNLKRLSYGDLLLLKKALKEKLDLEWNINKNYPYYYLSLRSKDIPKFMENIKPYITQSFMYKILDEVPSDNNEVVI